MKSIGELLRRGSTETEQQRAETKKLFSEITSLAPQIDRAYYVSASLGNSLFFAQTGNNHVRTIASSLDLRETDPIHVSWSDQADNNKHIQLHNNGNGLRDFGVDFDARTFAIKGINLNSDSLTTDDQTILIHLFETMRDDLSKSREDWKNSLRDQRTKFIENLLRFSVNSVGFSVARAVEGILRTYSSEPLSVFGYLQEEPKEQPQIRTLLFSTMPIREDQAERLNYNSDRHAPFGIDHAYYIGNLKEWEKHGPIKKGLVLRYSDELQVTIEDFYPASVGSNQRITTQPPHGDDGTILEDHFRVFLEGQEVGFHNEGNKRYKPRSGLTLLARNPNQIPNGILFNQGKFIDELQTMSTRRMIGRTKS